MTSQSPPSRLPGDFVPSPSTETPSTDRFTARVAARGARLAALVAVAALAVAGAQTLTDSAAGAATSSVGPGSSAPGADETAGRGSLPVGRAVYPVPDGALFVSSATGSDANPGTIDAPFQTVAHALQVAQPGATLVLRAGTYHESVFVKSRLPITIENYPKEAVWFDGTVPVSNWTPSGTTWTTPWTPQFDSTAGLDETQAAAMNWLRPGYPMAAHPDEVYYDGTQLTQVASAAQVVPGTFYSDYANSRIVLGSNPAGHDVRAADLQQALEVQSPGSVIRGIGFRRYATSVSQLGSVQLLADNQTIQNCIINGMASAGLRLRGTGQTVDHVTASYNGLNGMRTNMADHLTVSNSVFTWNNREMFNYTPVAAGAKFARSDYDTVVNNLFADNYANGLWFDTSSFGMTVVGNDFLRNERSGLTFELSASGLVANNTAAANGFDGIRICDTGTMRVWNNTLSGNATRNLDLDQDSRVQTATSAGLDPRRAYPDPTLDWKLRDIQVANNVMIAGGVFHTFYQDDTHQTAAARHVDVNHNLFSYPAVRGYSPFAALATGSIVKYTLPGWTTYSGDGTANVLSSGTTAATMAGDLANTANVVPLPTDIAAATGLPAGTRVWGAA